MPRKVSVSQPAWILPQHTILVDGLPTYVMQVLRTSPRQYTSITFQFDGHSFKLQTADGQWWEHYNNVSYEEAHHLYQALTTNDRSMYIAAGSDMNLHLHYGGLPLKTIDYKRMQQPTVPQAPRGWSMPNPIRGLFSWGRGPKVDALHLQPPQQFFPTPPASVVPSSWGSFSSGFASLPGDPNASFFSSASTTPGRRASFMSMHR